MIQALCRFGFAAIAFLGAAVSSADIVVPGADGTDGSLIVDNTTLDIDLSKAVTGKWDDAGGDHDGDKLGDGVYDPEKWAVVFKYDAVELKRNAVVRFKPHPSNAPVIWLVTKDVTIRDSAYVSLGGQNWTGRGVAAGGPGGFRGGAAFLEKDRNEGGGGMGPGGGHYDDKRSYRSGSYSGPDTAYGDGITYGNERIIPLIGGSGGGASRGSYAWSGAGGGGAILIAAQRTIDLPSANGIFANGGGGPSGYGSGSGGAIRLISDRLAGSAYLQAAAGGYGSAGRIRVEANEITYNGASTPKFSFSRDEFTTAELWLDDSRPFVRVAKIGGKSVPDDPSSRLDFPHADVSIREQQNITVEIDAWNVPSDWIVTVRAVPKSGFVTITSASRKSGDDKRSTWTADVSLGDGFSAIQVRASKP